MANKAQNRQVLPANLQLVWVNGAIDPRQCSDVRRTLDKFKQLTSTIHTFNNEFDFFNFISNNPHGRICLVISGSLGQKIVPKIHQLSQIESILVFCSDVDRHRQWAQPLGKVRDVEKNLDQLCERLRGILRPSNDDSTSISFAPITFSQTNGQGNPLDMKFTYTQVLKEILFSLNFNEEHRQEFISYAREKFKNGAKNLFELEKFEKEYDGSEPFLWYTKNSFLYRLMNRALREMDVLMIVHMGFFIRTLHERIKSLNISQKSEDKFAEPFEIYRGQGLPKSDFQRLKENPTCLLWFSTFLSTSSKQSVGLEFARKALEHSDFVSVLFVMRIDPQISSAPFALIRDFSYYQSEEEILFSMHTCFRVERVMPMPGEPQIWRVDLCLTKDNDEEMRRITEKIRRETFPEANGWYRLAMFCMKLKEFERAEAIYRVMLKRMSPKKDQVHIFHQLAEIKREFGAYSEALQLYNNAIEIQETLGPANSWELMILCENKAMIYYYKKDYSKALADQERILGKRRESLPRDHVDLAVSYNRLGMICSAMKNHSQALYYYYQELEINEKDSSCTTELADNYLNIASQHLALKNYPEARNFAEKNQKLRQKWFSHDPVSIGRSYGMLAEISSQMNDWRNAQALFEKALNFYPKDHADCVAIYRGLAALWKERKDDEKVIEMTKKAMKIQTKTLGKYHPDLIESYRELSQLYRKIGNHDEASNYERKMGKDNRKQNNPSK